MTYRGRMAVLATRDQSRLRALDEAVRCGVGNQRLFDEVVFPEVAALFRSDVVAMYEVGAADHGVRLERLQNLGLPTRVAEALPAVVDATPVRWGFFDPLNPEPKQRNRALTRTQCMRLTSVGEPAPMRTWYARAGLLDSDQCRALLCEGDHLLAWFGAFREPTFGPRERALLQALVPALRDCLTQRAHLADAALNAALLGATLERVSCPAFILTPSGGVRHANAPGRAALTLDPTLREVLRGAARPGAPPPGLTLTRLSEPGVPAFTLALLSGAPADTAPRVAAAAASCCLTPREATVLGLLARGLSNKGIAAALRCAPATVEIHVSRLLAKCQAETRGELIAAFWRRPH